MVVLVSATCLPFPTLSLVMVRNAKSTVLMHRQRQAMARTHAHTHTHAHAYTYATPGAHASMNIASE